MDAITQHGHESIKQGSKSFALASRVLPPALRDDASMLYAWCRYCDDVIDGQIMGHGQEQDYKIGQKDRLERLRSDTAAALSGAQADNPVYAGLARVVAAHDIDHRHPFDLLKGFEMDAEDRVYETTDDILDYSYHVAGVVGVMMANIMGVRDEATLDRASDLGLAFQLTNIARDVIDDAKAILGGMLSPEIREEIVGVAEVRDVFNSPKFGQIAGSMVIEGTVYRSKPIRVLRDNIVIYEGELESLRRFKDDANEVRNGMECGIGVKSYNDVRVGDKIEVYETTEVARSL